MRLGLIYSDALEGGGYPRDVRWLATALARHGLEVTLFCRAIREPRATEGLSAEVRIRAFESLNSSHIDVYHVFGIFIPEQLWRLRQLLGKPLVVSPMGHLMSYHLRRKALKKVLYLHLVKPILKISQWFHVFSCIESSSVTHFLGNDVRTFEAGLGVFPVPESAVAKGQDVVKPHRPTNLLFVGRNDIYQKGIDVLLEGFARLVRMGADVRLTIAGRPWGNSERYIREFIEKRGLGRVVQVLGPVTEDTKWTLLAQADYLIFLSRWDGPPRPIREAIAVGTPVIVTAETNMAGLVTEFKAGMEVKLNPEEVGQVILKVSQDEKLRKEHRQGVVGLRERLCWARVAEEYIWGYRQVLEDWK